MFEKKIQDAIESVHKILSELQEIKEKKHVAFDEETIIDAIAQRAMERLYARIPASIRTDYQGRIVCVLDVMDMGDMNFMVDQCFTATIPVPQMKICLQNKKEVHEAVRSLSEQLAFAIWLKLLSDSKFCLALWKTHGAIFAGNICRPRYHAGEITVEFVYGVK